MLFALALLGLLAICAAQASGRRHAVNPPDGSRTPRLGTDNYSVRRGNVLTVTAANGVLANDSDPQGKPLSAVLVSGTAHGALFLNGDGSFIYASDGGSAASDSFVYTAINTAGNSNSARVFIAVAADKAPIAANDSYTTAPGTTLTVSAPGLLSNDVDADGDALTAVLVAGPVHGALTLNADGSFTYTPDSSNTNDSFTYAASDGTLESNAATVSITLDSSVRAAADTYPATQNTPRTVDAPGVLANDLVNGAKIVSYGGSSGTEQTTLGGSTATTAGGSVTLNSDGSLRFTPAPYFAGADTFKYKLSNTAGSSTAVVLMMVFAAPTAKDDSYSASSGTVTTTIAKPGVLANDTANSATITGYGASIGNEQTTIGQSTATAKGGTVTLGSDGGFTYTPPPSLTGSDTFKYTLGNFAGSSPATVTIDVSASPFAASDSYQAPANATFTAATANGILANDTQNGATLVSYGASAGTEQTSIGASTPTAAGNKVSVNADGSFAYVPATGYSGTDSFKYKLSNSIGTAIGAVTIVVTAAPLAVSDSYAVTKNSTLAIAAPGLLANDTRNGGAIVSYGSGNGTEQTSLGNPAPTAQGGTIAVAADGAFNYTPPSNFTGSDTFHYILANNAGKSTATVTLAVSQAPVTVDDSYVAVTAGVMSIVAPGVLTNDTLNGGKITSFGANGTEQSALGSAAPTALGGSIALAADGSFSYTTPPNVNPSVAVSDSFRYVAANSSGSSIATVTVLVSLQCPVIAISPVALPAGAPGVPYTAVFSQTGGTSPVAWSIPAGALPPGLSFSTSGVLSGTPAAAGFYTITVKATDAKGCSAVATLPLSIACPSIAVTPSTTAGPGTLPAGIAGVAYSAISFAQSGGTAPITWSVPAGSLPPGLTLSSSGAIAGTPTATGTFVFTVQATDANGCIGALPLSLTVNPKCPVITIAPASLPSASAGVAYPAIPFSQSGGAAPVTWTSSALPPGMSFSTGGVLSGTPTGIGVFNVTVTATDANGCTATLALPLGVGVTCPTIVIPAVNLAAGVSGVAYTAVTLTANGGVGTIAWSLAGGALPAGMTFSGTGVLAGTPAQTGTFNFTVQATDTNGCFATRAFTLVVSSKCPAIAVLAPPAFPAGVAGKAYPGVSFSQAGGTAPVTWTSGALPTGMTLSAAGVLSGTPAQTGTFTISVTATDANGCTGTLAVPFTVGCPAISISPTNIPGAVGGAVYSGVTFAQTGGVAPIVWDLAAGALPAGMTLSSAGALAGTPAQTGTFNVTVRATDSNGCPATQAVSLVVTPKCPAITIAPPTLPSASLGVAYAALNFTQTGGAAPVTWASGALPPGMSFSTAGVLFGTPATAGVFNLSVTLTDANGCTATASLPFAVNATCPAITIAATPLAAGKVDTAYGSVTLTSSGGNGAMTWSVSAGTFPSSMSLSTAGVLSGTPTQAGTYNFTVKATDANGCFGTRDFSLTVNPKCPSIAISAPNPLPAATAGSAWQAISFTQSGGTEPVTWSSGALPSGMSFSTAGVLSGTPAVKGSFNITVQATDANGCTATLARTLTVNCPTISVSPITLSTGIVGTAYTAVTLSQTGGVAPITWSIAAGGLPPGMSLSTAGVLSGTPTAASTANFTVQATDANGCFGTLALTLVVNTACPTITITPPAIANATAGVAYGAVNFSQSGGTLPVAWTAGSLPTGMTLSADGVLAGTPAVVGTFNLAITVTDAKGCAATIVRTITISCPTAAMFAIVPTTLSAGKTNVAYSSATFSAGAGVAPITWSVSAGLLPGGMTLSGAGVLSGTPVSAGTYNFTVKATDANGCFATQSLTLTINPACTAINVTAPAGLAAHGVAGVPYSAVSFSASGGTAPMTWAASGNVPPGMTFSTAGVFYGTPTVTGTFNLTVVATDANGCTGTTTTTFIVDCPTVAVVPSSATRYTLPGGTTGTAYSFTFLLSGGTAPINWSLSAGTLPTGLTMTNGVLSGTPVQNGTFDFTLRGVDANGCADTQDFRLVVVIPCPAITVTAPSPMPAATAGVAYSAVTFTQSGGNGTITWSMNPVPAGMTFSSSSGVLAGTPTVTGTFAPTITATDVNGCTGSTTVTLVISCSTGMAITPTAIPTATVGNFYGVSFAAAPAVAPITWTITGLPAGLSHLGGGTISGTPTEVGTGSFTVNVTVADAAGCSTTVPYTLAVSCGLGMVGPSSGRAFLGQPYSVDFDATQSYGTVTFSTSSTLPQGMSLNSSTGTISGTPDVIASNFEVFTIVIVASDSAGCTKTHNFTLQVCIDLGPFGIDCP